MRPLSLFAALALGTGTLLAQDVQLTLHADSAGHIIPKEIYGQFAEHLGRCIYGGIWVGPDSDIPNVQGYRRDVFEAIKALEVPVLRWPGGCFADEYHWMDGIGPQEQRTRLVNNNWGGTIEDNSFGTHEFLNLCEMLGCEPYISGNVGSGSVEEMAKWVEYMTSDSQSTMAELRRKNGREKPWRVKYFGVGNESWGCGGEMRAEYYADLYRRYAIYCRNYSGNQLYKVASGANAGDVNWTRTLMRQVGTRRMHGLSVHYYAVRDWGQHYDSLMGQWIGNKGWALRFTDQEYYDVLSKALGIEDCITRHMAAMDEFDPERRVALLVDEWGTWYNEEPGTRQGWLYQQNTMRDAVVAASSLDIFHKYTARIRMANIAQMVNVLQAMILTNEKNPHDPCVLTPTYHVFNMYKAHREARHIPLTLTCDSIRVNDREVIPTVSATASRDAQGRLHLSLSNLDASRSHTVTLSVTGVTLAGATGQLLTHADLQGHNDFKHPDAVHPVDITSQVRPDGRGGLLIQVPAHSVMTLQLLPTPSLAGFADGIHHWNLLHAERDYARLDTTDYRGIADNLLAYQNADGGWMKNIDWLSQLPADSVVAALTQEYRQSTLDNRNTFPQIEYLAEAYRLTGQDRYRHGAWRALRYLLDTQKQNGGWRGWDVDAITFNDEVTTGCLHLFQRILEGDGLYAWVDDATRREMQQGYDRGIRMILDTQIVQDGIKTAWCQQHDNTTLAPCGARTFELPGITANESCPVIDLLMDIRNPSAEVIDAVRCAVQWLERVAIRGIRVAHVSIPVEQQFNHEYPYDAVVVGDAQAPRIWARFYELADNTPFFACRSGQKVATLAEVNGERRTGYDWYGYWPERILARYKVWEKMHR